MTFYELDKLIAETSKRHYKAKRRVIRAIYDGQSEERLRLLERVEHRIYGRLRAAINKGCRFDWTQEGDHIRQIPVILRQMNEKP